MSGERLHEHCSSCCFNSVKTYFSRGKHFLIYFEQFYDMQNHVHYINADDVTGSINSNLVSIKF